MEQMLSETFKYGRHPFFFRLLYTLLRSTSVFCALNPDRIFPRLYFPTNDGNDINGEDETADDG